MKAIKRRSLFFVSLFLCPCFAQAQFLRIYYPDIEQGASTLVVAPTGNALLIDAGSGLNEADVAIEGFINDLIEAGIVTSLDYILVTHYDEDHIGRSENVFQLVPLAPGLIAYDRGTSGGTPDTFAYSDYSFYANQHNRTTLTPNTTIALGGGVTVRCYVVNGELPDGSSVDLSTAPQFENAVSAAFAVRYGDVDIWVGGDLVGNTDDGHPPVEQSVAPFVGDVDVYTVDHHGSSATSSAAAFLDVLKAEVAINQNSVTNNFGHPNAIVVNRFKATLDTFGNTPIWFQTNPGDPNDTRSDDSLADGIADPDDVTQIGGLPGTITLISDGGSYQVYGGNIEPLSRLADSGVHVLADFPPAILTTEYAPLVPLASETVSVEAEIRDEGPVSAQILYEVGGVPQTPVAMAPIGASDRWQGSIPAQSDGTLVTFRVETVDGSLQSSTSTKRGYFSGTTPIASIRVQNADEVLLTSGYSVRIRGIITAEPGIFHPTVSQIYVQDADSGINIFDNSLLPLSRGDDVVFVGEIEQFGGIAEVVIAEDNGSYGYSLIGAGSPPAPQVVTLAQLDESTEGLLVRVNGVTITSGTLPDSGSATLSITDDGGTTIRSLRIDEDTDIPGANTPTGSFDIIGIVTQFDSSVPLTFGYQVSPRERTDFISDEVNLPPVLISEIHADPDPVAGDANGDGVISSTQDEFVEILNTTFAAIDISGYSIADITSTRFTFPPGTVLPPREAAVVFGNGTPTGDFGNAAAGGLVFTAGSLGLNNDGDTLTLRDGTSVVVQVVSYGSEGGDNQSLTRDPDWTNTPLVKHTTTAAGLRYSPGARNDGSAYTLLPGKLLLSEVMYDPNGADGGSEWVEIVNVSDQSISLDDVSIGGGGSDYTSTLIQLAGTIGPGEVFVVGGPDSDADNANPSYDQVFNITPGLQNSGTTADGVALFNVRATLVNAATIPIDAVIYGVTNDSGLINETGAPGAVDVGDAPGGATIERVDLAGNWQIQVIPSPNQSPLVSEPEPMGIPTDIILTEVFYDYDGGDDTLEWIEIHNKGDLPVNLAAMSIGSGGNDYTTSTVQLGGIIPAGTTWVIGGPGSDAGNGNPVYDLVFDFEPDIQNSGTPADGVALFGVPASQITPATVPVDAVIFGGSNTSGLIDETGVANAPEVGDAPAGSSIERINLAGDWQIQAVPAPNLIGFSTIACDGFGIATLISIPVPGADVDIRYGAQNLVDGETVIADEGDSFQWRLSVNGFNGNWQTHTVSCDDQILDVTSADYCQMTIAIPFAGGEIDIRYGPQDLADGATVFLPKDIAIQWRLSANGFNGPWQSRSVGSAGCTISAGSNDYCTLAIGVPFPEGQIDIRYGPQDLADAATVILPKGIDIQWRLSGNGFNGPWQTHSVGSSDCMLAATGADFCALTIDIPVAGAEVDIRYGPQGLVDGDMVNLPQGIAIQWRLYANGFNGPWQTHDLDPAGCTLSVEADDYCQLTIANPLPGSDVDIRYGPQNLADGSAVLLPQGIAIQWRLSANGFNGPWLGHNVGDTACTLTVAGADYCELAIGVPFPGGEIDLRYGPQDLADGANVGLPAGIDVQWRITANGFAGPWQMHPVGGACSLAATGADYCELLIDIPDGAELDIRYGPQNLGDGATVFLPKNIAIQYRLNNGPWLVHNVGATACTLTAN